MSARTEARLARLEATVYGAGEHQQVNQRLDHLTGAVGELSQNGRALALDVKELRIDVAELRSEVRQGFTLVRTDISELRDGLTEVRSDIAELRDGLAEVRTGLTAVLDHLKGQQ